MWLTNLILGRPLPNRQYNERRLTTPEAVPAMGLDGLASAAYGPEAALTVLIPAGAAGLAFIAPVMWPILGLMGILYISYRQTIRAYPMSGGGYVVSRENLGTNASLVVAAALMIDYVLNVAVGISAGVAALTSAAPALHPYTVALCIGILLILTLANLRGTGEASRLWAVPTYLFIASFLGLIGMGLYRTVLSGGQPQPVVPLPTHPDAGVAVTLWLLLRAFAAGCTAMTGIEAVSNGVSSFKEPVVKRAHHTLGAICLALGLLLAGIAYLARSYGIGAMDQTQDGYQSILSQLAGAIVGRGALYYVAIGSALCVLCLSANTSFVAFPRLCRIIAKDDFLPRSFAVIGRRLVFSVGISYLAVTAGVLLVVFGGITDRLIPLFAIGAFLTFTMSQSGMVMHWWNALHSRDPKQRRQHGQAISLAINLIGTIATATALVIIVVAKFTEGAWITIVVMALVIALLKAIKRYYVGLDARLREDGPISLHKAGPPLVMVATEGWNRLTDRALQFALQISPDVVAVHICAMGGPDEDQKREAGLRKQWEQDVQAPARRAGLRAPRLIVLDAPFRRLDSPLLRLVRQAEKENAGRVVAVLIPEVMKDRWWQHLLHTHRAWRVRRAILQYGGSRVVVINMPWYLDEPKVDPDFEQAETPNPVAQAGED
jgi:amino acid transporter